MADVKGTRKRRLADIDDLSVVEFETSEEIDVVPTFDRMGLNEDLLRGIYSYGIYFYLFLNNF